MKFIGLRLCEHDSNISYSCNQKVKYYKSERDFQVKHHGFDDLNQWTKIIKKWNIDPKEIDAIGIVIDAHRHSHLKFDESKLYETVDIPLFNLLGFECPIFRVDHHYAHSLGSWCLGIDQTISFVFDGFGDNFSSHTIFKSNEKVLNFNYTNAPSLGVILSMLGEQIGVSGTQYDQAGKVMALKGHGLLPKEFINAEKQRLSRYNINFLDYLWNLNSSSLIDQEIYNHIQICHEVTEDIFANHFRDYSEENDVICYSGGVAQNTVINSKIKKVRPNLHILPHCNDEGLSLGVIEFLRKYFQQEPFDRTGFPFWQSDEAPETTPSSDTIKRTADHLANGKIVGWYQGNGEVGSRALGNRSILMNPTIKNGKEILNDKVKHREWYRPFGASILEEETKKYFDWDGVSPYMLYVMDILDKESFPAITHVDGTCRIQTVSQNSSIYYNLIDEFRELTGIPMVLNTSLNNGGKPICGSIADSLDLFSSTNLDILVVGNEIYEKT
ncbi:MAG: carbamoyltransferase C-terminal domain-containing protein [Candidatus Nanopelagicales bacterium]